MNLVRRILLGALLTVVVVITAAPAHAQVSREAELKGKLVGVLGRFDAPDPLIKWPAPKAPSATNPLKIGILGGDPFVDNTGVNHLKRRLPKAEILRFATAEEFMDCHILFVSKSTDLKKALAKTRNNPILVVSESPGQAKEGSVVNFMFDQNTNTIRMEINPKTASRLKLSINRDLLLSPLVDIVGAGN